MKDLSKNYIVIQGWMVQDLGLSSNNLLVYSLIYGFCQDDESEFTGSINYICKWLNCSRPTASKSLEYLCENNLLIKIVEIKNGVQFNRYKVNFKYMQENFMGSKEALLVGSKETLLVGSKETLLGGSKETLHNNTNINKTNNNKIDIDENFFKDISEEKEILLKRWINYRIEIKNKLSKSSIVSLIKKFNENEYQDCLLVVEKSINNGWRGLFWDKINNKNSNDTPNVWDLKNKIIDGLMTAEEAMEKYNYDFKTNKYL